MMKGQEKRLRDVEDGQDSEPSPDGEMRPDEEGSGSNRSNEALGRQPHGGGGKKGRVGWKH